ncbi:MAG TPA: hypothetical protein VE131_10185 [Terriglobales bacterium]|nr:hypothetical protein [Terriglobales bacterium]
MTTITSTSLNIRNSILRSIALGGMMVGLLHLIIQDGLVFSLLGQKPFILVLQYVASGALGNAAFAGGLAIALLGLIIHFLISFVVAGVFILSADRISLLRRNVIFGSILYGVGVFVVLYFVILPLSAAPPVPPKTMDVIELIIEHVLVIGLPLGLFVRRTMKTNL